MGRTRTRLARIGAAVVLGAVGLLGYDAVTQVARAAPPPVVTTDYAAYPPAGSVPADVHRRRRRPRRAPGLSRLPRDARWPARAVRRSGPAPAPSPADRCAGSRPRSSPATRSSSAGTSWTAGCESLPISFPLKATNDGRLRHRRRPDAGPGAERPVQRVPVLLQHRRRVLPGARRRGFELSIVVPAAAASCAATSSTSSSAARSRPWARTARTTSTRTASRRNTAGLGTFNPNGPNMLIDAANGDHAVRVPAARSSSTSSGSAPAPSRPPNVPPGFQLTVTSSVSDDRRQP